MSDGNDQEAPDDALVDLRAHSDTRERLVRAAAEVFREKGYTGSRVQDIARRAGFTSGALYVHFDSRAELLAEAIAAENSRMFRLLSEGIGRSVPFDAAAVASSLAAFVALESSPTDQLMLDGFAICTREAEARHRIGESVGDLLEKLETSIRAMPVGDGSVMAEDPAGVAYLMVAFMSGVAALRAAGLGSHAPEAVEEVLAGFLHQLGALSVGGAPPSVAAAAGPRPRRSGGGAPAAPGDGPA